MKINIKEFKSIYREAEIELKNDVPNILLGANGSGKTTLLESFNFILEPKKEHKTSYLVDVSTNQKYKNYDEVVPTISINVDFTNQEIISFKEVINNELFKDGQHNEEIIEKLVENKKDIKISYESDKNEMTTSKIFLESIVDFYGNKIYKLTHSDYAEFMEEVNTDKEKLVHKIYNRVLSPLYKREVSVDEDGENIISKVPLFVSQEVMEMARSLQKIIRKINSKPKTVYLNNAAIDGGLKYEYSISHLFEMRSGQEREKIKKITSFLYPDLEQLRHYYEMDEGKQRSQKRDMISTMMTNTLNEILEKFPLNFLVKVVIENNNIKFSISAKKDSNWVIGEVDGELDSDGNKAFVEFIIMLNSANYNQNNSIFGDFVGPTILIADEPEKNLSPILQSELKKYIAEKVKSYKGKVYFIYTTHSPIMFDRGFNTFIIDRESDGNTGVFKWEDITKDDAEKNQISGETLTMVRNILEVDEYVNSPLAKEYSKVIYIDPEIGNKFKLSDYNSGTMEKVMIKFDSIDSTNVYQLDPLNNKTISDFINSDKKIGKVTKI